MKAFLGLVSFLPLIAFANYDEESAERLIQGKKKVIWTGEPLEKGKLYDASKEETDWQDGYVTLFIGERRPEISKEEFKGRMASHLNLVKRQLEPFQLEGYVVFLTENLEIAYQKWRSKKHFDEAMKNGTEVVADAEELMKFVYFDELTHIPCEIKN